MKSLPQWASAGVLGDGCLRSELRRTGVSLRAPLEILNVDSPEVVERALTAFLRAGAAFLTTNTLAANRIALSAIGMAERLRDINRRGTEMARRAIERAGAEAVVLGQIGPSGKLMSLKEADPAALEEAYAEQAVELEISGAAGLLLAGFRDAAELVLAVRAAKRATSRPVLAALVFDSGGDWLATAGGDTAASAAAAVVPAGADAFGCDAAVPEAALTAVSEIARQSDRPVFVRASVGGMEMEEGRLVFREAPEDFASRLAALRTAGAAVVCGGLGATAAHMAAAAAAWRSAGS